MTIFDLVNILFLDLACVRSFAVAYLFISIQIKESKFFDFPIDFL